MDRQTTRERALCAAVLAAVFFAALIMRLNCDNLLLDDWTFFGVLELGEPVGAFLLRRWQTWSSRLLIEGALCLTTRSIWAWRVLDSGVLALMSYALCRLAGCHRRPRMLLFSGLMALTIPFAMLRSTGWQATSVNYTWPLSCALAAMIPLGDALRGESTGKRWAALALPLALFGANQEQMAAALFGAYLALGGALFLRERRVRKLFLALLAVSGAELAMHLLCPGNAARAALTAGSVNLRDYAQFSLIDRLSVGLTSTTALLFFTNCPFLLLFTLCTALTALARRRGALALLAVLPLAIPLLGALCGGWSSSASWAGSLYLYGDFSLQLGPARIGLPGHLPAMGALVALLGLIALSPYLSLGHRGSAACAAFAYALGFAARMAVSLSPSVVESGERTMLPLYAGMMLCALLCVKDADRDGSRRLPVLGVWAVALLLAAANFAGSFALAA